MHYYRNCSSPYINYMYMCTMLTELLYPLQNGCTPLHYAAKEGHTTCVKQLLSIPGIYVKKIQSRKDEVIMICMYMYMYMYGAEHCILLM